MASIFLRKNWLDRSKNWGAGGKLARLSEKQLRAKLALLSEMKLLERDENVRYNVHPAVRDGFLRNLDEATSRLGHKAVREWLQVSLGDQSEEDYPSDSRTLDVMEEIVHHALAAGNVDEAWWIYRFGIGTYEKLGLRLGDFERGERICCAFAGELLQRTLLCEEGLSEYMEAIRVNEWAMYLSELGGLDTAARCHELTIEFFTKSEDWWSAAGSYQNLVYVLLWSLPGVWFTLLLARLGQNEKATSLTEMNKLMLILEAGSDNIQEMLCNLVLADLARERHDLDDAHQLVDAAHEWAIDRDAKEILCWSALVRARLEQDPDARRDLEDGLRIARDCGFGIYHVDLLLERARRALDEGDADAALVDVDTAVFAGVRPPEESGLPELLAATDPECGYAWGEAEGRQLRGEALLVRAAQTLGRGDFAPARFGELPEDVRGLVDEARQELEACRRLREKIQDPKVAETADVLAQLDGGVLTRHPLEPVVREETTPSSSEESVPSKEREKAVTKKHVFLSYVRETSDDVQRLRDDLIASGETVWWDRDIPAGANWKLEIRKALKDAYAFVLCLSKEMAGRDFSGAFPEIRDAIAIYRELAPGKIFILPVRLSECEVPTFEIDSTTTLEDLQLVDLFPEAERSDALRRLIAGLRACPGHP